MTNLLYPDYRLVVTRYPLALSYATRILARNYSYKQVIPADELSSFWDSSLNESLGLFGTEFPPNLIVLPVLYRLAIYYYTTETIGLSLLTLRLYRFQHNICITYHKSDRYPYKLYIVVIYIIFHHTITGGSRLYLK